MSLTDVKVGGRGFELQDTELNPSSERLAANALVF